MLLTIRHVSQGESASSISRMALGRHVTVFCITNI